MELRQILEGYFSKVIPQGLFVVKLRFRSELVKMTWLAPLGILLSIVLIIYFSIKGYSILFMGPLCSVLVILTNQMDVFSALISAPNSYMMGLAQFIANFFMVFLLGSILAKYMEASGAARSIAEFVLKLTGTENPYSMLLAIFLICSLLTFGGVSLFVVLFAIIPLSRPLFKQMNISWSLIAIPIELGILTFTMTMLPGSPSIQNVIPTTTLGTTLTAGPLLGLVGTVVVITFGLWYMKRELDKSIRKGEVYEFQDIDSITGVYEEGRLPHIGVSLAPLLLLIAIIFIGSFLKIHNIIILALVASILFSAIVLGSYTKGQKEVINAGAQGAISPIFFTAAAVGFGSVINAAPGFKVISDLILHIPGNPLISLSIVTSLMSIITGSSSGSLGIIMQGFAKSYLDMGIIPDVLHRIAAMSSGPLSLMPHSGVVLTFFALTGLNHKNSYKHIFISTVVGSFLAMLVALVLAIVIY